MLVKPAQLLQPYGPAGRLAAGEGASR
ncbi:MAG: hypothetical protein JWQ18_684, partial [Conexibacter sp.]|nr:hypothetical protein [Conexibacter sp.]